MTEPLKHGDDVNAAAFSPDGGRVVTASNDHTARVWDARTGQPLTAPLVHGAGAHEAVFSSDGERIVTASADNTARVWVLPIDRGSPDDWKCSAHRGLFTLENGVLAPNH